MAERGESHAIAEVRSQIAEVKDLAWQRLLEAPQVISPIRSRNPAKPGFYFCNLTSDLCNPTSDPPIKNHLLSVTCGDYSSGSTPFGEIAPTGAATYNRRTL